MQQLELSLQLVTVDQTDVDKMLDCYDSGMSDTTTANAVARALKRLLKPVRRVRVIRDQSNRRGFVQVGRYEFDLPEELCEWLIRAERAFPVEPISFRAALPNDWLVRPIEKPEKRRELEEIPRVA